MGENLTICLPGIKQNKNKNTQEKILHTRSPYLSFSRTRRNEKYRFFGKSISDKKKHVKSMISEIAVSHTSSCMVRGTLVLVLYYSYTYREPINRILLFTVLLPIQLLSIFNSFSLRFQVPQNWRASFRIIGLFVLMYYYKQRDGLNLQQQQQQQQRDERFI